MIAFLVGFYSGGAFLCACGIVEASKVTGMTPAPGALFSAIFFWPIHLFITTRGGDDEP